VTLRIVCRQVYNKNLSAAEADNQIFSKTAGCDGRPDERDCLYKLTTKQVCRELCTTLSLKLLAGLCQVLAAVPMNVYPLWATPELMDLVGICFRRSQPC
jgi:hypothetical protein